MTSDRIRPRPRAVAEAKNGKGYMALAALPPQDVVTPCMPPKGSSREEVIANADWWTRDLVNANDVRRMREKCGQCPALKACRERGLAHEAHGMWGGLTADEREVIREKRGQVLVEPHIGHQAADDFMKDPYPPERWHNITPALLKWNAEARAAGIGRYADTEPVDEVLVADMDEFDGSVHPLTGERW